jgi:hypothetical protein
MTVPQKTLLAEMFRSSGFEFAKYAAMMYESAAFAKQRPAIMMMADVEGNMVAFVPKQHAAAFIQLHNSKGPQL